jgi:hypothetical protein
MSSTEGTEMSPSFPLQEEELVREKMFSQIQSIIEQRQGPIKKMNKDELLQIIHSVGRELEVFFTKPHLEYYLKEARMFEGMLNYLQGHLSPEEREDVDEFAKWTQLPSEADRRRVLVQWGINCMEECAGALIISKKCHDFFLYAYIPEEIEVITESDMIHNKLFTTRGDTRSYEHEGACNDKKDEEIEFDMKMKNPLRVNQQQKEKKKKTIMKTNTAKEVVLETETAPGDDRRSRCDDNSGVYESEPLISKEVANKKHHPWSFSFSFLCGPRRQNQKND